MAEFDFLRKTDHRVIGRIGSSQISIPLFSHLTIATAGVLMVKLWFLSPTDFPSYRARLPLMKPEGEAVELWLAKFSL